MARKKSNPASQPAPAPGAPSISIGGNVDGPLNIGNNNTVVNNNSGNVVIGSHNQIFSAGQQLNLARAATPAEIAELGQAFNDLHQAIAKTAPPALAKEAAQQADALQAAVASPKPDVTAMGSVKTWFVEHLPAILGGVTGLLTNPIVGKLVEAAGEFTLDQFRVRLGLPAK
jgi:predicted trehalose synthase